jgi:serine/threonine protein kinase
MGNEPTRGLEDDDRLHEAITAFEEARDAGLNRDPQEWLRRYPEVAGRLADYFADGEVLGRRLAVLTTTTSSGPFPAISDYAILEELGRGGMGVVYKARQLSANRLVALKLIRDRQLASADDRERFRLEAESAANLDHPHIVPLYDVGQHEGLPYFSMKLVDGRSLAQLPPRSLRPSEAAELIARLARGVHHAHQRGILYRDVGCAGGVRSPRT